MRESIAFYLRLFGLVGCLWFASVSFFAPLFFTFSRDELSQSPRKLELYVRDADRALDMKDLMRARYFLNLIDAQRTEMVFTSREEESLDRTKERMNAYSVEYATLLREREYWSALDAELPHGRDIKYMQAMAEYSLLNDAHAVTLLEQATYLDPQFEVGKQALFELTKKTD